MSDDKNALHALVASHAMTRPRVCHLCQFYPLELVRYTASSQVLHPTHIAVVQAATHRFVIGDTLRRVLQIVSTVRIVHETHKLPATIFNITPTRIDFFFSQRLSSNFCLSHYFVLLKSHRSMNMIQIKKKTIYDAIVLLENSYSGCFSSPNWSFAFIGVVRTKMGRGS